MDRIELFKQTYFQECSELLASLEVQLAMLRDGSRHDEVLHEAFRAVHSIKGGAGAFGFSRLISYVHGMETVFDLVRDGRVDLSDDFLAISVRSCDILADLVRAEQLGEPLPEGYEDAVLRDLLEGASLTSEQPSDDVKVPSSEADGAVAEEGAVCTYRIEFHPKQDMLRRANEPLLIVRHLKELGQLNVIAEEPNLPSLDQIDPTGAYLAWTFELETRASLEAIKEVFEFVEDDCKLSITELDNANDLGVPEDAEPAAENQVLQAPAQAMATSSIRVDLDRIDRFVNLVGEIAIGQAMVSQQIDEAILESNPKLVQDLAQLVQHTRDLQESVMAIRAQPVQSIFVRMPRVVRDLSEQTGKQLRIETEGEHTEIDKTVIEQLSDPLTHMIRNAVDHGIESPEERVEQGKSPEGNIHLSAEQRGSRIVFELKDDGRGIDRERVREKAIEKNLISESASLSNEEIDNLIFLPGFSTVDEVSSISGRGVGMDVVHRNIRKLGGRVLVRSEPGEGTTFFLTLPLTLAVLDGMVVRAGSETFVVPLTNIIESAVLHESQIHRLPQSGQVIRYRGEYLNLINLKTAFNIRDVGDEGNGLVIIVEVEDGSWVALEIDEILGQQQVVIKNLEENYDAIPGIAGATILGKGEVALILDVTGIQDLSANAPSTRFMVQNIEPTPERIRA